MSKITKRIRIYNDYAFKWTDVCSMRIAYIDRGQDDKPGTEAVTKERFDEIRKGVRDGTIIGIPVYALYKEDEFLQVKTSPFIGEENTELSGYAYYLEPPRGRDPWAAPRALVKYVKEFNLYLSLEVYKFSVEDVRTDVWVNQTTGETKEHETCTTHYTFGGFFGSDPNTNGMCAHLRGLLEAGYVFTDAYAQPLPSAVDPSKGLGKWDAYTVVLRYPDYVGYTGEVSRYYTAHIIAGSPQEAVAHARDEAQKTIFAPLRPPHAFSVVKIFVGHVEEIEWPRTED